MAAGGNTDNFVLCTEDSDNTQSADVSVLLPTEELHEIDTRTPTVSGTNGHATGGLSSTELDYSELRSAPETNGRTTGGLSSAENYSELLSAPATTDLQTSSGADSSGTNTTYQRQEDGDTVITDAPTHHPAATRGTEIDRRSVSNESPLGSVRHGSITGARGFGGAGPTSSVNSGPQKSSSSRWPSWCLCGRKDDREEAIPARESSIRR